MSDDRAEPREAQRVEQFWSGTPYHEYGRVVAPAAAEVVDFVGVSDDDTVLDVACGTGNTAITAARRGASVTGIDLSEQMLEWAAETAGLIDADIDFRQGDARNLPVEDDAYDVTLSTFGHQLSSDPVGATRELARVTKSGGRVGFAAYRRGGSTQKCFEILSKYHPEMTHEEAITPYKLGGREFVVERVGDQFESLSFETKELRMPAVSPRHFWDFLLTSLDSVRVPYEQATNKDELMDEWVELAEDNWERNAGVLEYLLVKGEV